MTTESVAQDPERPDRPHGLPVGLHVLQLGAERGRYHRQEGRPALLLHPEDLAGISHSDDCETQLMFAGHNAYRFASDPFYANGFIPTVKQLVDRIASEN